ncbi:Tic20 family protein [Prochlorococcus marinus]|uniref:Uncharacterized protein n=1 Tax=Prochlorococcus marinus (strain MIT 9211) TaxID=93059 RepID=A9BDR1_PROM4|nr:Tic20 family protein [Prochlorococcus marinus]ABX09773.1 Hypothetical protein P9211_18421 [Prochlorococcus marinus str. MIT 9211]
MLIPIWQRVLGFFVYILPFTDALPLGSNLFIEFPILNFILIPALPIIFIKANILLGSLLIFLILFIGVVRNQNIAYFLRFNTLQALLINIAIIIVNYGLEILIKPLGNSLLIRSTSNTIFIVILTITVFSIIKCLQGEEPDLPGISEAVRIQI